MAADTLAYVAEQFAPRHGPDIDNLTTLCIDQIDADRLALKKRIEESLLRLEKETLINRSGDNFFFLTNEERDINREIKSVDLSSGEEAKVLGEIIFDDVLKGTRKHRYQANDMENKAALLDLSEEFHDIDNFYRHQKPTWEKLRKAFDRFGLMGACFEVYKEKGCGFLEPVYQECLAIELEMQDIPFVEQRELDLTYKGRQLKQKYKPDFICFGKIILEIKALKALCDEHRAQVHNYLKATGYKLGLLVNFGHYPKVEWERIVP